MTGLGMVSEELVRLRFGRDYERDSIARLRAGGAFDWDADFAPTAERQAAWYAPEMPGEAEALRVEVQALFDEFVVLAERREEEDEARAIAEYHARIDAMTPEEYAAFEAEEARALVEAEALLAAIEAERGGSPADAR